MVAEFSGIHASLVNWKLLIFRDIRTATISRLELNKVIKTSKNMERETITKASKENVLPNQEVSGFEGAGILSKTTFWWLNPLLSKGREKTLEEDDLPKVCLRDQAESAYSVFTEQMLRLKNDPSSKSRISVRWALYYNQRKSFAITAFFAFIKICTLCSGPLFVKAFIRFSHNHHSSTKDGILLAALLFICKLLESTSQRQWYFKTRRMGLQIRSALIAAIYMKQLKLSHFARQTHAAGEINNYVAVDAYRVGEFPYWVHQTWTTVLQFILGLIILFYTIGWATISVLVVLLLTVLLNYPLAKMHHKIQIQLMAAQDERLRAMTETFSYIKVLKLHAWEGKFKEKIMKLRDTEFKWLSKIQFSKTHSISLFWACPLVASAVAFMTCYLIGIPLTTSNVFTFIAALRLLQDPIRYIPEVIAAVIQAKVSLNRIDSFLAAPELQGVVDESLCHNEQVSITIKSATFSWETNTSTPTLRNIDLKAKCGEKVAICGAVGSGKSTLLASILGEVPKLKGNLEVSGSIAYVSQSAWIQSGTIQDNILFGRSLNEEKYCDVLQRCSLVEDLKSFPFGDQTQIGERGVNLSGGQKQRAQLARALYQDADIYLLDDPFSALDANTASNLFKDYLMEALSNKTVILVTHQVDFLPAFDVILVLSDGEISQAGKYEDLLLSSKEFTDLVNAHKDSMTSNGSNQISMRPKDKTRSGDTEIGEDKSKKGHTFQSASADNQLIKREEKGSGDTFLKALFDYLKQNNGFLYFSLASISHLLLLVAQLLQNTWMASKVQSASISTLKLIIVYAVLSFVGLIFVILRSVFLVYTSLNASESFFSLLTTSLIRAPMSFFDSTPLGRIFSRVSLDLSILDLDLAFSLVLAAGLTLNAYSNIGVIAIVTWQVLAVILPMIFLLIRLQRYYFSSAKELMRMNGTTKSPISNHLGESIAGGITIRALRAEDQFFKKNLDLTDRNASTYFHTFAANEWLIQRVEFLSATVLCTSAVTMVLMPMRFVTPGFVGMALSYGLSLNIQMVSSIQYQSTLANFIVSVERIKQYMNIPPEAPEVIEDNSPPSHWPANGRVDLHDLKIKYRPDGPWVLKGITCTIQPGHRVGVVGRTGSGKTTLISALFRLIEPTEGRIIIDDIDITAIGLHDLRSRLGIIPQEPTLFKGTVRFNVDPLSEFSDMEIWEALNKCQLGDIVKNKQNGLDSLVGDDGDNWSVGQRQLFCLGRALLRKSKILVLDEATASIDNATDMIMQTAITKEFQDCTVITVAHRIPTVMDSDMVLAINNGEMVEYDKPLNLIEREGSLFGKLVSEYWSHSANAPNIN